MRATLVALVFVSFAVPAVGGEQVYVDLDRPGALDELARANPRHYDEVVKLTKIASRVSCDTGPRLMPVPTAARNPMECVAMTIMTSEPPKRRITFEIDHTRYGMVVTLETPPGGFLPAR